MNMNTLMSFVIMPVQMMALIAVMVLVMMLVVVLNWEQHVV